MPAPVQMQPLDSHAVLMTVDMASVRPGSWVQMVDQVLRGLDEMAARLPQGDQGDFGVVGPSSGSPQCAVRSERRALSAAGGGDSSPAVFSRPQGGEDDGHPD